MTDNADVIPLVDLKAQLNSIKPEIDAAIAGVLDHCGFVLGPDVKAFEQEFAAFTGTQYALGVSSGLDAIRLALKAVGVGFGDEVIIPANTFIATALAISDLGAKPVLVDCDRATYEMNAGAIEAAITPRTKAIMPVHLMGLAAEMDAINAIADKNDLPVIEDAAQSQGSTYKGKHCGSLSAIGCTSFFPGKNLGAYGDGGAVTTDDPDLFKKMDILHNYGQEVKYHHIMQGLNCRLDTMQAAILRVKLRYLPKWNEARRAHVAEITKRLKGVGDLRFQTVPAHCVPNYHLFIVETEKRDALKDHLTQRGVMCGIHYPIPVHMQEAYQELGYKKGAFPHAEYLAEHMVTLPMYAELTPSQIDRICDAVKSFFA